MKNWIIISILILIFSSLQGQDIKEIVKDVRVDIQYSKKYDYYIVSPFANNNIQDCIILETNLDSSFQKIKDGIWLNENYTVKKCNSKMGNYYLFIKKEN
jgi:hypothetical protein